MYGKPIGHLDLVNNRYPKLGVQRIFVFEMNGRYHAALKDKLMPKGYLYLDILILGEIKKNEMGYWQIKHDKLAGTHWKKIMMQLTAEAI
jgi:hypothetical protein